MGHASRKLDTLTYIRNQLLLHPEGYNITDLVEETQVHIATVSRHLEEMGAQRVKRGVYRLEPSDEDITLALAILRDRILNQVMTTREVVETYDVTKEAVLAKVRRGTIWSRRSGKTFLMRRVDAEVAWGGKKGQLKQKNIGEFHPRAVLTEIDVRDIRRKRKEGWTLIALAHLYRVSKSQIGKIVLRQTWKHI